MVLVDGLTLSSNCIKLLHLDINNCAEVRESQENSPQKVRESQGILSGHVSGNPVYDIYCDVPGSLCLSKIFHLGGYLACLSLAPCLVAARPVCWRPRLAGTRQDLYQKGPLFHGGTEVTAFELS